jgi:hypothetical protein
MIGFPIFLPGGTRADKKIAFSLSLRTFDPRTQIGQETSQSALRNAKNERRTPMHEFSKVRSVSNANVQRKD